MEPQQQQDTTTLPQQLQTIPETEPSTVLNKETAAEARPPQQRDLSKATGEAVVEEPRKDQQQMSSGTYPSPPSPEGMEGVGAQAAPPLQERAAGTLILSPLSIINRKLSFLYTFYYDVMQQKACARRAKRGEESARRRLR